MNEIFELAVERGLIRREEAERLLVHHERSSTHPIRMLLDSGVDECALYEAFAAASGHRLVSSPVLRPMPDCPIGAEHLAYFEALPYERSAAGLLVLSWRWDRRELIPAALKNLGGVEVELALVTLSEYEELWSA